MPFEIKSGSLCFANLHWATNAPRAWWNQGGLTKYYFSTSDSGLLIYLDVINVGGILHHQFWHIDSSTILEIANYYLGTAILGQLT